MSCVTSFLFGGLLYKFYALYTCKLDLYGRSMLESVRVVRKLGVFCGGAIWVVKY